MLLFSPFLWKGSKSKILTTALLFILSFKVTAQGDLIIIPKRVVLEKSNRTALLNISNISKDTATYTISFQHLKMLENGSFVVTTKAEKDQNFADEYIRFYPRKFTLGPNEIQTIKLQVHKFNELKPGEYRSHIYFRSTNSSSRLSSAKKDSTISIKLTPIYGISIPAIIRKGNISVRTDISDISLKLIKDNSELQFTLNRLGNISIYGDIKVEYIPNKGKNIQVGGLTGLAVYAPNAYRKVQLKLDKKEEVDYTSGKLLITFTAQDNSDSQGSTKVEIPLKRF
jgi:hypothetical protein